MTEREDPTSNSGESSDDSASGDTGSGGEDQSADWSSEPMGGFNSREGRDGWSSEDMGRHSIAKGGWTPLDEGDSSGDDD